MMGSKSLILIGFILITINLAIAQKKYCLFGGPTDAPTLRNANFIENFASGYCLKQEKYGFNSLQPITLDRCSWDNRYPAREHLFQLENHNGGSTIRPTLQTPVSRCMVSPTGTLASNICIPKSDEQTWVFNLADKRRDLYTMMKKSNRKCLKLESKRGKNVVETYCNSKEDLQLWRICSSTK